MVATRTPKANNITHVEYVEIDFKQNKEKERSCRKSKNLNILYNESS